MNGIPRLRDVMAAEQRLDEAEKALNRFETDSDEWSGHEAVDEWGKRTLYLPAAHFDRRDALVHEQQAAASALRNVWAQLLDFTDQGQR